MLCMCVRERELEREWVVGVIFSFLLPSKHLTFNSHSIKNQDVTEAIKTRANKKTYL